MAGNEVVDHEACCSGETGAEQSPGQESAEKLINHIVARYHEVHRKELPELVRLAEKVESVHKHHPDSPRGLASALRNITLELEGHMIKEEHVLFPLMRSGGHPMISHPILMMKSEHDDHEKHLQLLENITADCQLPDGACRTWQALYAGLRKLIDDLRQHIRLENEVLFPRFEAEAGA